MGSAFVDACRFSATSTGTGDFVVLSSVVGYQTPATAAAVNGVTYSYRAESADLTQWECGFGVYTSSTTTLARTTVTSNSSGTTSKINFTNVPQVAIVALTRDLGSVTVYNVVTQYGADPTGTVDSTTKIQAAIDAASATGYGGIVYFPPGTYTTSTVLTIASAPVTLRGAGRLSSQIRGTGAAQGIVLATTSYVEVDNLAILGPNNTVMTGGTAIAYSGCQGGKITNCFIANCYVAITMTNSTNNMIAFNKIDNVYGTAWVNFAASGGGNYFHDNQLDGAYFSLVTFTLGTALGAAWQASHGYAAGNMVSSGGYWYACTTSGISAASGGLALTYYGNTIIDNAARWKLIGKTDAVLIVNTAAPQNYIHDNDLTSICAYLITVLNSDGTQVNHNQGGGAMQGFINIDASNTNITIDNNYFTASNAYGITDTGGNSVNIAISGNKLQNVSNTGMLLNSAYMNVNGNLVYESGNVANTAAIAFGAGVSHFNCQGNVFKKGAGQTTAAMVQVFAGASDFYIISGNTGNGFATVVSDAGGGTNKTVSPNW